MRRAFVLLAVACAARTDRLFRLNGRAEVVSEHPEDDANFARFGANSFGKTYDQRLYQCPLEDIEEEVALPPFAAPAFLRGLAFDKTVDESLGGLHRSIEFKLSLEVQASELRLGPDGTCSLALIDYCANGFYIDFEEVEQDASFAFLENERMDIEKMDGVARQYAFALRFRLSPADFSAAADPAWKRLSLARSFPFHLRYGEANRAGRTLYRVAKDFDVATDCWQPSPDLQALRQVPRYAWALDSTFGAKDVAFVALDGQRRSQSFVIPVGNTTHLFWVQLSTKALVCYGLAVSLFALLSDYKQPKPKQQ